MGLLVTGRFAAFGNVDSMGQIVDPGAFSAWLERNEYASLPIFWAHDHLDDRTSRPIGKTTSIIQRADGAYFTGELAETPKAEEIAELVQSGSARGASFAYREIWTNIDDDGTEHLVILEPVEITIATWGANPKAYTLPLELQPEDESEEQAA